MGPIAYLQANKIEVRVKQVPFAPNFLFAFTGEGPGLLIATMHVILLLYRCCVSDARQRNAGRNHFLRVVCKHYASTMLTGQH